MENILIWGEAIYEICGWEFLIIEIYEYSHEEAKWDVNWIVTIDTHVDTHSATEQRRSVENKQNPKRHHPQE